MFERTKDVFRAVPPSPRGTARWEVHGEVAGSSWGAADCLEYSEPFCGQLVHLPPPPVLCSPLLFPPGQHSGRGILGGPVIA